MIKIEKLSDKSLSIWCFVLAILTYATSINNPFHFDDFHSIVENPHLRNLKNIPIFFVDTQTFSVEQGGKMFRPLLLASFAINYAIHGYEVWGYRAFNILLHVSCVIALFRFAIKMGSDKKMAVLMGCLFLINPIVAEPINYISSRSDLFVSSFVMWSICYLIGREGRYVFGVTLFICGFLVKSMAIVMPLLLFMCDRSTNIWANLVRKKNLIASLFVVIVVYVFVIYSNSFLGESINKIPRGFIEQIFTHIKAQVYMVWLCVMPVHLTVDHAIYPALKEITGTIFFAALLIFSLSFFAIRSRTHWLSIGWIWQVAGLLPYAFIPLNLIVTERRMYLAVIGFSIIVAWGLYRLKSKNKYASYFIAILLIFWSGISVGRSSVWAKDISLWKEAVDYNPINSRALVNLGLAYQRSNKFAEAKNYIKKGLSLNPEIANGWLHLGNLQFNLGDNFEAEQSYLRALSVQPNLAGGYYNLGNILLGRGEIKKAEQFYMRAIKINPYLALAHNNLGQIHASRGNSSKAFRSYEKAITGDPGLPEPYFNQGLLHEKTGDYQRALDGYSRAYKIMSNLKDSEEINRSLPFKKQAEESINRLQSSTSERK